MSSTWSPRVVGDDGRALVFQFLCRVQVRSPVASNHRFGSSGSLWSWSWRLRRMPSHLPLNGAGRFRAPIEHGPRLQHLWVTDAGEGPLAMKKTSPRRLHAALQVVEAGQGPWVRVEAFVVVPGRPEVKR
jgi:hypothetical protein